MRAACAAIDRDPAELDWSVALPVCVGRDDAEVARRAEAIGRDVDQLVADGLGGTVDQVVEKIGRYAEVGAGRFYLQVLDLHDPEHLELVAAEVAPQLR